MGDKPCCHEATCGGSEWEAAEHDVDEEGAAARGNDLGSESGAAGHGRADTDAGEEAKCSEDGRGGGKRGSEGGQTEGEDGCNEDSLTSDLVSDGAGGETSEREADESCTEERTER